MDIKVKHNQDYRDVFFSDQTCNVSTGLLDTDDRVEFAEKLINAAYELLTDDFHSMQKAMLATIQENL